MRSDVQTLLTSPAHPGGACSCKRAHAMFKSLSGFGMSILLFDGLFTHFLASRSGVPPGGVEVARRTVSIVPARSSLRVAVRRAKTQLSSILLVQ